MRIAYNKETKNRKNEWRVSYH